MNTTTKTEQPTTRMEWQAGFLRLTGQDDDPMDIWQLRVGGRVVLNAVSQSDLHEAVAPKDRQLIGQAIAEFLENTAKQSQPTSKQ